MTNPLIRQWLAEHGKGDLQECTWEELRDCLEFAGCTMPLYEYRAIVEQNELRK